MELWGQQVLLHYCVCALKNERSVFISDMQPILSPRIADRFTRIRLRIISSTSNRSPSNRKSVKYVHYYSVKNV